MHGCGSKPDRDADVANTVCLVVVRAETALPNVVRTRTVLPLPGADLNLAQTKTARLKIRCVLILNVFVFVSKKLSI